jgi:hypothetical protein
MSRAQQTPIYLYLAWPLALSFCYEGLGDFAAGLVVDELLVSKLLVIIFFWSHRSTLLPSRLVNLAG